MPNQSLPDALAGGLADGGTFYENYGEVDGQEDGYLEEVFRNDCRIFNFTVSVLLVGISCLLGFFGNLVSIVILRRDPRKSVTLFLLTALAVADFIFLIPIIFLFTVPGACRSMVECSPTLLNMLPYINQYGWAVASMAHTGTVYITMLVTIHRYISVCRPLDAPKLSTLRLAKSQVICVILFAITFNIPRFLEFQIRNVRDINEDGTVTGTIIAKRTLTAFGDNIWYQIIYKNLCFYLFMLIIPLTTLIILSCKLTKTLRERKRYRFRVSLRRHRKEDNTTLVLIIIVTVFVVCQTPTAFQRLFYTVFGDDGRICGHFFFYFECFADYLAVLNSCVNFMVYVIFAKGFRQTLKNTMCQPKPYYRAGLT